ncbi:MAG: hypothetical protein HRT35_21370 [Algicola sp.]|nr:hypothetical protein [Algicola sp.]
MDANAWGDNRNDDPSDRKFQYKANSATAILDEMDFIDRQSKKLRLFDPQNVYCFKNAKPSLFQSFVHFVTMLVSFTCLVYLWRHFHLAKAIEVVGAGTVSSSTVMNDLFKFAFILVIFYAIVVLSKLVEHMATDRYRLAMLANSFNRTALDLFTLLILLWICKKLFGGVPAVFANGVYADIGDLFIYAVEIVIIYRGFRFCHKEVAQ